MNMKNDDDESVVEDSTDSLEESEEELEDHTWTDADGNPIVSVKEE